MAQNQLVSPACSIGLLSAHSHWQIILLEDDRRKPSLQSPSWAAQEALLHEPWRCLMEAFWICTKHRCEKHLKVVFNLKTKMKELAFQWRGPLCWDTNFKDASWVD